MNYGSIDIYLSPDNKWQKFFSVLETYIWYLRNSLYRLSDIVDNFGEEIKKKLKRAKKNEDLFTAYEMSIGMYYNITEAKLRLFRLEDNIIYITKSSLWAKYDCGTMQVLLHIADDITRYIFVLKSNIIKLIILIPDLKQGNTGKLVGEIVKISEEIYKTSIDIKSVIKSIINIEGKSLNHKFNINTPPEEVYKWII